MTNNICGHSATPLRGDMGSFADSPTLRIGLISAVPSAQRIIAAVKLATILVILMVIPACSSRSAYIPEKGAAASHYAININTASIDEFEKLPHIGRKTAESIVEFREANGPFRRVEHLMQIRGISEERFLELRPFLKTE